MLFSKNTGGVYDDKIHKGAIPDDALPIPDDLYQQFKDGEFSRFDVIGGAVARYVLAAPSGAQVKAHAWEEIKAERDRRIQSGGYKVGTKWFHSDTFSRTQQMGLAMLGANIPANTLWKTMDGTTVTMTQALAGQIFAMAAASDIAIFAAAESHRAAMEASADPADYDFSAGWPAIYGE